MEKAERKVSTASQGIARSGVSVVDPTKKKRKGYPKEERPLYTAAIDYKRLRESDDCEISELLSLGSTSESHSEGCPSNGTGKSGSIVSRKSSVGPRRDEVQSGIGKSFHFDPSEAGSIVSTYITDPSSTSSLTSTSTQERLRLLPATFSHDLNGSKRRSSSGKAGRGHVAGRKEKKSNSSTCRDGSKGGALVRTQSELVSNELKAAHSVSMFSWTDPQVVPTFTSKGTSSAIPSSETGVTCPSDSDCITVNRSKSTGTKDALGASFLKLSSPNSRSRWETIQDRRGTSVLTVWGSQSHQSSPVPWRAHSEQSLSKVLSLITKSDDDHPGVTFASEGLTESGPTDTVSYRRKDKVVEHASSSSTSSSGRSSDRTNAQQSREGKRSVSEGESDKDSGHTFVLSSGRLSKEEEKKIGRRPPTIDDDFEKYFSQLGLQ